MELSHWLRIENLTFQYRHAAEPTLRDFSFEIRQGETVVLMGRSGSGKSTICYILNGLIPQFLSGELSGKVRVDCWENTQHAVWQQSGRIGLVFQDFDTQLVSTNVEMELIQPLEHLDPPLSEEEMARRITGTLEQVGLAGLERRDPLSLSGGQRQRLVMASTFVRRPRLSVLDQPMTDMDPLGRAKLRDLLTNMKQDGMTLMVAEQESEEVLHADRICVLDEGKVKWEGAPDTLFRQPDLVKECGIRPLPLAQCFEGLGLPQLPVTVEEAWRLADEHGLIVDPAQVITTPKRNNQKEVGSGSLPRDALVQLDDVTFTYDGGIRALENITCSFSPGEFVAVLGQNGSGKSTLARLLNGLLLPTQGNVQVEGKDTRITSVSELSKTVGYVFQNPDHQIFAETVWDEVEFGVRNIGFPVEECERRVFDALSAVGLDIEKCRNLDPFSLTKGERQRVAVASVLAARPRMLIFDEPSTGLDTNETDRMMEMLRILNQQGHTIVMITHIIRLVADYATRGILIKDGRVDSGMVRPGKSFRNRSCCSLPHLNCLRSLCSANDGDTHC